MLILDGIGRRVKVCAKKGGDRSFASNAIRADSTTREVPGNEVIYAYDKSGLRREKVKVRVLIMRIVILMCEVLDQYWSIVLEYCTGQRRKFSLHIAGRG